MGVALAKLLPKSGGISSRTFSAEASLLRYDVHALSLRLFSVLAVLSDRRNLTTSLIALRLRIHAACLSTGR